MSLKTVLFACALVAAAPAAYAQADETPVATAQPAASASPSASAAQPQAKAGVDSLGFDLEDADGAPPAPDKKIHGEFGVGIGSNCYREAWGVATAPIGDHAAATVAVDDGQFGWRGHTIQNRSLGVSLAFGVDNGRPPPPDVCGPAVVSGPYAEPLWMSMTRRELRERDAPCP